MSYSAFFQTEMKAAIDTRIIIIGDSKEKVKSSNMEEKSKWSARAPKGE